MKDKDKVVERLTGEKCSKEVLAVTMLDSPFKIELVLDGDTIIIDSRALTWEIGSKMNKIIAEFKDKSSDRGYSEGNITIRGPRKKINNILVYLGKILINDKMKPYWEEEGYKRIEKENVELVSRINSRGEFL